MVFKLAAETSTVTLFASASNKFFKAVRVHVFVAKSESESVNTK